MKTILCTLAAVVLLTAGPALAGEEGAWLDLENCAMCRHLTTDPELFEAMTWDTQLFKNGFIEVTTIPAGFEERFQKLMTVMMEAGQKLAADPQAQLCGMCRSYGALLAAGADMEQLQSGDIYLSVTSSRDPAVVEQIHKHGQRTIDEYAKWMAAEGEGEPAHGEH